MRRGRQFYRRLRPVIWTLLLVALIGCVKHVEYVRSDSGVYRNAAGDVCMSPGAFADLTTGRE